MHTHTDAYLLSALREAKLTGYITYRCGHDVGASVSTLLQQYALLYPASAFPMPTFVPTSTASGCTAVLEWETPHRYLEVEVSQELLWFYRISPTAPDYTHLVAETGSANMRAGGFLPLTLLSRIHQIASDAV